MATAMNILGGTRALRRRARSARRPGPVDHVDHVDAEDTDTPHSPNSGVSGLASDEGFVSGNGVCLESPSFGSEDDEEYSPGSEQLRPRVRSPKQRRFSRSLSNDDMRDDQSSSGTIHSRSWHQINPMVLVALAAPVGNWITGGDQVKNLVSLLFLVWYLHQIIEVPWRLYRNARPRKRDPLVVLSNAEDHYKHIAASELRRLELFYLFLSAISPLLGALTLRVVTVNVLGTDAVSWFSTTLFVLATGTRPWSHVVERLGQRGNDLHNVIHYPPSPALEDHKLRQAIGELSRRVEQLEDMLSRSEAHLVTSVEEVYDYVDEAVTAMDKVVLRQEKRYEKHDAKFQELEQTLAQKDRDKHASLVSLSGFISSLAPSAVKAPPKTHPRRQSYPHSPPPSRHSLRCFPSTSSATLETIPEEAPKYPLILRPINLLTFIFSEIGHLVTWPFRVVSRVLLLGRY